MSHAEKVKGRMTRRKRSVGTESDCLMGTFLWGTPEEVCFSPVPKGELRFSCGTGYSMAPGISNRMPGPPGNRTSPARREMGSQRPGQRDRWTTLFHRHRKGHGPVQPLVPEVTDCILTQIQPRHGWSGTATMQRNVRRRLPCTKIFKEEDRLSSADRGSEPGKAPETRPSKSLEQRSQANQDHYRQKDEHREEQPHTRPFAQIPCCPRLRVLQRIGPDKPEEGVKEREEFGEIAGAWVRTARTSHGRCRDSLRLSAGATVLRAV